MKDCVIVLGLRVSGFSVPVGDCVNVVRLRGLGLRV